jgi:hypothetical protein
MDIENMTKAEKRVFDVMSDIAEMEQKFENKRDILKARLDKVREDFKAEIKSEKAEMRALARVCQTLINAGKITDTDLTAMKERIAENAPKAEETKPKKYECEETL